MAEIELSEAAQEELASIITVLKRDAGIAVGQKYRSLFFEFFDHLAAFPESCQARPRLGKGIRLGVVARYSVLYSYDREPDHLLVIRILHGRRKLTRRLLRED